MSLSAAVRAPPHANAAPRQLQLLLDHDRHRPESRPRCSPYILSPIACSPHSAGGQCTSCYLPQFNAAPALLLPQLKQLDFFDVVISKKAMEHLLRSCTALKYLRLEQIHGFISLHIASTNLRWIYVSCWPRNKTSIGKRFRSCTALKYLRLEQIHGFISLHIASTNLRWIYVSCWPRNKTSIGKRSLQLFHVMVIENAPFLERLLVSDLEGPTKIRVIDAPKLTALVHSSAKLSKLFIGSVIVQVQQPPSTSPSTN